MRVRNENLRHQVGILLEEAGIALQVIGNFVGKEGAHNSISPVNTVTAGPVIRTGRPGPPQAMVRSPPRVVTRTGESSRPRRIPATAAAQAPGTAGQGLTGATLVHAQADLVPIDDLHETGVDPLGEALVAFDQRPVPLDRVPLDIVDHLHGVRITHRNHRRFQGFVGHIEEMDDHILVGKKRNLGRQKTRLAHVDRDIAVGFEARGNHPLQRLDADLALVGQALLMDETDEATRAVAALLDLAAIGIEDPVAEIDAGLAGRLDQQNLIATDPEIAVGEVAKLFRGKRNCLTKRRRERRNHCPGHASWRI